MLNNNYFFHDTIKKMVVSFGALFTDIIVQRRDKAGVLVKEILVPISYSNRDKFITRLKQNPILEAGNVSVVLPRLAYSMTSLIPAAERRLPVRNYNLKSSSVDPDIIYKQFNPAPYDLNFQLYVVTDLMSDTSQCLEQISVFFNPEFSLDVNMIPEMGITQSVPVVLNTITVDDSYEGELTDKRMIISTVDFSVATYLWGPIKSSGIIRRVQQDIHVVKGQTITADDIANAPRDVRLVTTPSPLESSSDDSWEPTTITTVFTDGRRFDPHTLTDVPEDLPPDEEP